MNAATVIDHLRRRGFALRVVAGSLRIRPVSQLTPEERKAIRDNLHELIVTLTHKMTWDGSMAIRLMEDADSLVDQLGVSGSHPQVMDAATMVVTAHATRDMVALRSAVAEFEQIVRRLAKSPARKEMGR